MTTCGPTLDKVEEMIEQGMSAEEIGERCDGVKNKKRKAKYLCGLIAARKGMPYRTYVEKYPTLGLQPQKARKTPPEKKDKGSDEFSSDIPNVHINDTILEKLDEIKEEFDANHPRKDSKPHSYSSTILNLIKMYTKLKREHPELEILEEVASQETPEGNA
jgi:hypothetical protein